MLKKLYHILPIMLMILISVLFLIYGHNLTVSKLIRYIPKDSFLMVLAILALFAIKSMVVVFPLPLLYILTALIYDPVTAFILNILGAVICTTVPYFIGRFSGSDITHKLIEKYPKIKHLNSLRNGNEFFFSFIVRAIGLLPCDAVSLVLGSMEIDLKPYLLGTTLGMLPGLISTTMVGSTITNPRSMGFILSCVFAVSVSTISILLYKKYVKSKNV